MIKKVLTVAACLTAVAALSLTSACGSGKSAEDPSASGKNIFTVRVDGGTGDGDYYEGDICQINAETPAGKQFMYWLSGDQQLSSSEEYLFTVSGDMVITAVYADAVEDAYKNVYTVSVGGVSYKNGITQVDGVVVGDGGYLEGSVCRLSLNGIYSTDNTFLGWKTLDAQGQLSQDFISISRNCTLTVTQDVTVVPVFDKGFVRMNTPGKQTARLNGAYLEFNREMPGSAGFVDFNDPNIDYVKVSVYSNPDKVGGPLGWFALKISSVDPTELCVEYSTGVKAFECVGKFTNCFRNTTLTTDHTQFFMQVLGGSITPGANYYMASQIIVKQGVQVEQDGIMCELGDSLESETNEVYYFSAG